MTGEHEMLGFLAAAVSGHIEAIVGELSAFAAATGSLLTAVEHAGRVPSQEDLATIRGDLQARLQHRDQPMDGMGMATTANYLSDSAYWLEWWRYGARGELEFVAHSLNPNRDSFYDYSSRRWYVSAAVSGRTTVTGPYVDVGGTNSYTVTVSVPVITGRGLAAVAGADIAAARFERFLVNSGRSIRPVVLVNSDLRVIASSTIDHLPGDVLLASDTRDWCRVSALEGLVAPMETWSLFSPAKG